MKIITVNVPIEYLKQIDGLVGNDKSYPSRSELIRCAIREYLIKELEAAQSFMKVQNGPGLENIPVIDEKMFVRVPGTVNLETHTQEFKTYRIVKKQSSPVHVQSSK